MSDSVDFYDVQNAVDGEARERRAAVDELRELVAKREREAHEAILELREHVASLERLIQSRTEHLVGMSALAEALLAAQRQAVGSLSKAFVAGKIDAEALATGLDECGLRDDVDQGLLG